jgi:hypothetical protein
MRVFGYACARFQGDPQQADGHGRCWQGIEILDKDRLEVRRDLFRCGFR